jgi:hypothetical protein
MLMLLLTVRSLTAKFRPDTVTDEPPLTAAFKCSRDATGPSNESAKLPVPATADTVICKPARGFANEATRQVIDVDDDQCVVVHGTLASVVDAVKS